MSATDTRPSAPAPSGEPPRRAGELGLRELGRWTWRQLTSMRTALVLLLLLALAAVPGSVIPQSGVDALAVSRWKDEHPTLAPVYERLDLFSVYDSVWFSAIYILLMISLVGCILPRTAAYARAVRAQPPAAPRRLDRLPGHRAVRLEGVEPEAALEHAAAVLRRRRYRLRSSDQRGEAVSAERGYLREVGNLLFHVSLLVVLAGFAVGALFGYQGAVIVVKGTTFSNTVSSYDDLDPGSRFTPAQLDPFTMTVDDFDVTWLTKGSSAGTAREFVADVSYDLDGETRTYPLRVNHPLTIGDTDVFLVGHGYAPVITVRDGEGNVAYSGPTVFLPQDQTFLSFGVVKAGSARPQQIGLDGLFFPTFSLVDGDPVTVWPDDLDPLVSMTLWTGDLGLDSGVAQSVYALDTSNATQVMRADGEQPFRLDLRPGETVQLPDDLGSVTFEDVQPWVRVQVSQTPGKFVALGGVIAALIGLLGSLFIRSRRVWVRARPDGAGATMVDVGVLERAGGGDVEDVLDALVADLTELAGPSSSSPSTATSDSTTSPSESGKDPA